MIHSKEFYHLDLKMGNILVFQDGHIKLADFGCGLTRQVSAQDYQPILDYLKYWQADEARRTTSTKSLDSAAQLEFGGQLGDPMAKAPEAAKYGEDLREAYRKYPEFLKGYELWTLGRILLEVVAYQGGFEDPARFHENMYGGDGYPSIAMEKMFFCPPEPGKDSPKDTLHPHIVTLINGIKSGSRLCNPADQGDINYSSLGEVIERLLIIDPIERVKYYEGLRDRIASALSGCTLSMQLPPMKTPLMKSPLRTLEKLQSKEGQMSNDSGPQSLLDKYVLLLLPQLTQYLIYVADK
ncbi:hypothetical protein ABW19_dt0202363 [Dactylella cylindrospora]|nr:hypothetical protein ABW19_dt0202363 [Dactylella cylindrospora]